MGIFRKKKKVEVSHRRREPNITESKKSAIFQYSSQRQRTEDGVRRGRHEAAEPEASARPKKRLLRFQIVIFAAGLLGLAIYSSILSDQPQIVVNDKQSLVRDTAQYEKAAREALASKLPNRSKLTLNKEEVASQLQKQFPEIASVELSTPFWSSKPKIKITPVHPAAIFVSGKQTYLLDRRGVAVRDISQQSPSLDAGKIPRLNDQTNYTVTLNKPAITSRQISYIEGIYKQSEAKNLTIESMALLGGGGELNVKFQGLDYLVKFNFYEDARSSMGTFIAVKEQNEEGSAKKPREYIDVRIPGRAYVK